MSEATKVAGTISVAPAPVTRIARRHAKPGMEARYEAAIREMFGKLRGFRGFMGADMIPPEEPGGVYQVVVNFASEADLQEWDESIVRAEMHKLIRDFAEEEPDYRRLTGLEAWFSGTVVPASMHPPRARMAVVIWLGIFPIVSFYLWLLSFWPGFLELPFLPRTAVFTVAVVVTMTWLVMPRLTKLLAGWLNPKAKP